MLRGTDEWAVWIDNGNHRVSAMASLQYEEVPIILRPRKTIRRSEADKWPAVREGVMTEEEAREVFDRIFEGRQPAAVSAVWPPAGTAT